LPAYRGTPIRDLLGYHNLRRPHRQYADAELLIGMCMDNRKVLSIPDNCAFDDPQASPHASPERSAP
jgi:carbonic anhydrase